MQAWIPKLRHPRRSSAVQAVAKADGQLSSQWVSSIIRAGTVLAYGRSAVSGLEVPSSHYHRRLVAGTLHGGPTRRGAVEPQASLWSSSQSKRHPRSAARLCSAVSPAMGEVKLGFCAGAGVGQIAEHPCVGDAEALGCAGSPHSPTIINPGGRWPPFDPLI